ncbi:MAG TPA: choice-of-anchor J domain-containing protein, partial [Chitinophagaceae bacterium]|nr:choice-of-anchor J domain-containing protein [Chitinophagaceae bacterium]
MKKTLLSLLAMAAAVSLSAQVIWQENFDGATAPALPAGFTQWNGDGLTVASNLSAYTFGTNAWVSYKATGSTNGVAVSTSWYNPVGTSNDWLISPAVSVTSGAWLIFDAFTPDANYPDGYQVKISTSSTPSSFTGAAVLTVPAEAQSWTTHAVDLSAYAGQTIYIAIINNSNDKYLLFVDNMMVKVLPAVNASMLAMTPNVATYKSYATVGGSIPVQALFQNQGSQTVTSYTVKMNDGTTTQSFPQTGTILPYGTQIVNLNYSMTSAGIKPIKIWAEIPGDTDHSNDTTSSEFGGATFTPTNNPVFEEAT